MSGGSVLLVSVPAVHLSGLDLPGSLYPWRCLRDAVLPPDLRLALLLVMQSAEAQQTEIRFVARPEIFTHGAARDWLDAQSGGAQDHLALTDGNTLRLIPGLRNHMFFFPRGMTSREGALNRLVRLVPEAFAGLASQVNGTLTFRLGSRWIRPPMLPLGFAVTPVGEPAQYTPFVWLPGNHGYAGVLSAKEAMEGVPLPKPPHYVPLTLGALSDHPFVVELARQVREVVLDPAKGPLLIGLPALDRDDAATKDQVEAVLEAFSRSGIALPRLSSWAVRFVAGMPDPAALAGARLTLHAHVPFWHFGRDIFDAVGEVTLTGSGSLSGPASLFSTWLGRAVPVRRIRPQLGLLPVTTGQVP
ncbi:hypothetical protein G3576_17445 [Roseomonas stagni]|uniref:Uncharacterized protein n=1 Tax=Falsiroseomonas algicola TaxID=2716930 RepID=A0A6M1LP47_9PROT|nr:hypothetical protein [Falsiroseomonas algicola]NGM21812.1 hypothetical protein [Falsiroseomonas algicola]